MVNELATLFGDDAGKLVFTGEDFPYSIPGFGVEVFAEDDTWNFERIGLLPRDAVLSGLGIRNGITENYNNHLNQVPAYGLTIQPNGHVQADENWVGYDGRVLGTENECFLGCGLQNAVAEGSERHRHEVMMANFKALQMRMNWIYASNGSNLAGFAEHWDWVRKSLGRQRGDAFDAWAVLRESRDAFFAGSSHAARIRADVVGNWTRRPWVRNMERWLVQRDVCGDGVAQAGAERIGDLVDRKRSVSKVFEQTLRGVSAASTSMPTMVSFAAIIKISISM